MNAISLINGNKLSPYLRFDGKKNIYLNQYVTLFSGKFQTMFSAQQRNYGVLEALFRLEPALMGRIFWFGKNTCLDLDLE
jgi:hypothetical protein